MAHLLGWLTAPWLQCPQCPARREGESISLVDVNIAGFLGFVMYNLVAFIGIAHCFSMTSVDVVTLHTVLNVLQNPAT
ncbi:MAG: hypothetical protein WB775_06140, partial [Burkholderiaceae bacterium]